MTYLNQFHKEAVERKLYVRYQVTEYVRYQVTDIQEPNKD